jgi:hypothetical protein
MSGARQTPIVIRLSGVSRGIAFPSDARLLHQTMTLLWLEICGSQVPPDLTSYRRGALQSGYSLEPSMP